MLSWLSNCPHFWQVPQSIQLEAIALAVAAAALKAFSRTPLGNPVTSRALEPPVTNTTNIHNNIQNYSDDKNDTGRIVVRI